MSNSTAAAPELKLLSIVIPARDEEGCIASTVEHLHVELRLQNVPHEIVVVDDGSRDATWPILESLKHRIPALTPLQNPGPHGVGRAIIYGLDHMHGDAAVIMMADESDDCRDVVRYWKTLNEGYDCVFGSRFMRGGGVIDYPKIKLFLNRIRAWVLVDGHSDYVAESTDRLAEAENQRNGQPLSLHLPLHLARKVSKSRRLPARWELILSAPMCADVKRQSPKDRPPPRLSDSADAVGRCAGSGFINKCGFDFP